MPNTDITGLPMSTKNPGRVGAEPLGVGITGNGALGSALLPDGIIGDGAVGINEMDVRELGGRHPPPSLVMRLQNIRQELERLLYSTTMPVSGISG